MTGPVPQVDEFWALPATDIRDANRALWWSVSPEGHLGVVLVQKRFLTKSPYVRGWVGLRPKPPFDAILVIVTNQGARRAALTGIDFNPSHLALLTGGRFVLTGSRADQKGRPTAILGSTTGRREVLKPYGLGSHVTAVLADRADRLWATYADEGIETSAPWAQEGLAGWTLSGLRSWAPHGRIPAVRHGTAAATESNQTWLLWNGQGNHTARITPATGDVTSYPVAVDRCDGMAVQGTQALLSARDHHEPSLTLTRAHLSDGTWVETDRHHLEVPGPVVMNCAQGRDGILWLRAGDTWLRAHV